jgi:hypothetical protein
MLTDMSRAKYSVCQRTIDRSPAFFTRSRDGLSEQYSSKNEATCVGSVGLTVGSLWVRCRFVQASLGFAFSEFSFVFCRLVASFLLHAFPAQRKHQADSLGHLYTRPQYAPGNSSWNA